MLNNVLWAVFLLSENSTAFSLLYKKSPHLRAWAFDVGMKKRKNVERECWGG